MPPGRTFQYDWSWDLPATPEELWPLVSDTNRFNRDAGLPPVMDARAPEERLNNARRRLRIRVKGVTLEWEELPFEWLRPHSFGVVRRYATGPLVEMRVRATLESTGPQSTRLSYSVSAQPRGVLGALTTPIQIGLISRVTFARTFKRYAASATRSPGASMNAPVARPRSRARVDRLLRSLKERPVEADAADLLFEYVLASDDMSLARMRPYALAKLWHMERRDALTLCLHATQAGLLDLSWDVICPKCMGAKDQARTLRDLRTGTVHCDTCLISFEADFDQSVEISFSPSPAIRAVDAPPFCVAGPQVTPHVEVQQLLQAGETREVVAILSEGRHRSRAWGIAGGPSFLVEDGGQEHLTLSVGVSGWAELRGPVAPTAKITLVNQTSEERLFDVERVIWGDDAVTAAEVTALAVFRDIFASEVLDSGHFIGVGNLAVLFTDLRDSTQLYRQIGDAPAFGRVMEHFAVLTKAVAEADGAVVKTIGDAVMAVFRHPDDSLRAVKAAQTGLAQAENPLVLKAGIHVGPCIAVNQNDRLDYFGSTVNIAARLGGLSKGDDIVVSDDLRQDGAVEDLLGEWGATAISFDAEVRGIEKPLRVWRISSGASKAAGS